MIGWWGCVCCGRKVPNDHKGPCVQCGGRVSRMIASESARPEGDAAALPKARIPCANSNDRRPLRFI